LQTHCIRPDEFPKALQRGEPKVELSQEEQVIVVRGNLQGKENGPEIVAGQRVNSVYWLVVSSFATGDSSLE
jgi:hypothetical protein